jgi:hypothetical protein
MSNETTTFNLTMLKYRDFSLGDLFALSTREDRHQKILFCPGICSSS